MPIDLGPLTTTIVTTFLLPYAKLGLEKFGEAMMEKLGETAAEPLIATTKKIWQRVKTAFGSEEEKATLAQFEKRPEAAQALIAALRTVRPSHRVGVFAPPHASLPGARGDTRDERMV